MPRTFGPSHVHVTNTRFLRLRRLNVNSRYFLRIGFRTDVEISRTAQPKRERELQAWQPDPSTPEPSLTSTAPSTQRGDDLTFGPNAGGSWDQFAVNEEMFGITTRFDENVYTTKLDRTGKDFKEKEKRAERIAAEITGVSGSTNE